jgi:dihydroflavonol-4-reductase
MMIVTGAAGHLGAALVRALLAQGRQVRALVRSERRALAGLNVEHFEGDLRDAASLRRAFAGAEVVYHAAAQISLSGRDWPSLVANNVQGTQHVVRACQEAGVRRLVHVSSVGALVDTPRDRPVDEQNALVDTMQPFPYGYAKALAEREVRQGIAAGLDAVIVRPTAILGPYDYRVGSTTQLIVRAATGQMPLGLPGGFDFVDVRDVAAGALRAAEVAPCGADYNLSGEWAATLDVARRVAALAGAQPPRGALPLWVAHGLAVAGEAWGQLTGATPQLTRPTLATVTRNSQISHARAARELGYAPRKLDAMIADTLAWFQEQGIVPRRLPEAARRTA